MNYNFSIGSPGLPSPTYTETLSPLYEIPSTTYNNVVSNAASVSAQLFTQESGPIGTESLQNIVPMNLATADVTSSTLLVSPPSILPLANPPKHAHSQLFCEEVLTDDLAFSNSPTYEAKPAKTVSVIPGVKSNIQKPRVKMLVNRLDDFRSVLNTNPVATQTEIWDFLAVKWGCSASTVYKIKATWEQNMVDPLTAYLLHLCSLRELSRVRVRPLPNERTVNHLERLLEESSNKKNVRLGLMKAWTCAENTVYKTLQKWRQEDGTPESKAVEKYDALPRCSVNGAL